jgi:hypothetical protein
MSCCILGLMFSPNKLHCRVHELDMVSNSLQQYLWEEVACPTLKTLEFGRRYQSSTKYNDEIYLLV